MNTPHMESLNQAVFGKPVLARSRMIAVEGMDGSGKSSLIAALTPILRGKLAVHAATYRCDDFPVQSFSAWEANEWTPDIRRILVGGVGDRKIEALLAFAARRALLLDKIIPHESRGGFSLLDRYVATTFAYQCDDYKDYLLCADLMASTCEQMTPGLTFYLKIDPETALSRTSSRGFLDSIEQRKLEFFSQLDGKFRAAFELIRRGTNGITVELDARQPLDVVLDRASEVLDHYLSLLFSVDIQQRESNLDWLNANSLVGINDAS